MRFGCALDINSFAMTSTLKCNNCNLVVDEMLSYVQNKLSIIDEDSLTKICLSTFTSAQIEKSKSLLFESLPSDQRKPARKGQGKDNRVLNDIISVFKVTDPDVMPVFVARDLEKLPPITFDHLDVSKLLKDILLLQSEVKEIKSSYATVSQLEDLKKDLKFTSVAASPRNVNVRGESRRDSASLLLSPTTGSRTAECYVNLDSSVGSVRDSGNIVISSDDNKNQSEGSRCCVDGLNKNLLPISPRCDTGERPVVIAANESSLITDKQLGDSKRVKHKQSFADTVRQQSNFENEMKKQNNEWTLVQSRKQRFKERFMGKMGKNVVNSDEKFRAADRKETWLLSHEISYLNSISDDFNCTGTSAVDSTAGMLRGRPYGGVALLWRRSIYTNVTVIPCANPRALSESSVVCQHVKKRKRKVVIGWNKHVADAHRFAKDKFNLWSYYGRPTSGRYYDEMCESKRIFKSRLKWCQSQEDKIKMDNLASNHLNKDFRGFWKNTNKLNHKPSVPVCVDGVSDARGIAELFKAKFEVKSPLGPSRAVIDVEPKGKLGVRVSARNIGNIIQSMSRGKSPGHDGLSIEHLRWDGELSSPYGLESGVRQGGLSSPTLFNLYMDQLIVELSSTRVGCYIDGICVNNISYADDMVLLSASVCGLRKLVSMCERYASDHGLVYNVRKSVVMVFGAGGECPVTVPPVKINGVSLSRVHSFKYLGHILTASLRDDDDIERERRALSIRANMIACRFKRASAEVKKTLFRAFCSSFYTCSLWVHFTQKSYSALRVQYNNAFRVLMGLPRFCSASGMFAEMRVDCFYTLMRKRCASLVRRVRASPSGILGMIADRLDCCIVNRCSSISAGLLKR
uniref:SFRICE_000661 n=1 Tax=Spodoptera frugiperda TaxID=7108 RepID=A0A2H1VTG3_SPOFR